MVKKKVFSNAASHSKPIAKVLEQPAHPQPVGGLFIVDKGIEWLYEIYSLWLCQNSYWTWPFIVDLPIENGDFP